MKPERENASNTEFLAIDLKYFDLGGWDALNGSDKFIFLGSSFVAGFNSRTYLVTAGHIIDGKPLDSLRIFHSKTSKPLLG
jgi:hypothetical protein